MSNQFSVMEKGGAMTVNDAMCAFPPNCVSITSSAPSTRPSTLLAIVPLLFSFVFVKFSDGMCEFRPF